MTKRWPIAVLGLVAGAVLASRYRERLTRVMENVHTYSAPSAAIYDAVASPVLDGFFTRIAAELTDGRSAPRVLEIGCGPGRLTSRIAELSRDARVVGSDIDPAMLERAEAWADQAGVDERVRFAYAEAGSLPFRDGSFDAVVSTLSLHHWPDPAKGLAEIRRVLRPGGVARVYDIADWISRLEPGAATSPGDSLFGGGWTRRITTRVGPVPLVYTAELIAAG